MEGYIGQLLLWAPNFAPKNWLFCQGQTLPVSQNQALFSIIGYTYGGSGANFQLPDLRGATPNGTKVNENPGAKLGSANVALNTTHLPAHTHTSNAYLEAGNVNAPANNLLANTGATDTDYAPSGTLAQLANGSIANTGASQPVSLMQPYLGVNYIICTIGLYPSRP